MVRDCRPKSNRLVWQFEGRSGERPGRRAVGHAANGLIDRLQTESHSVHHDATHRGGTEESHIIAAATDAETSVKAGRIGFAVEPHDQKTTRGDRRAGREDKLPRRTKTVAQTPIADVDRR